MGDVLQMLSVAIATTVANTVPKDLPEEERNLYIDKAKERACPCASTDKPKG